MVQVYANYNKPNEFELNWSYHANKLRCKTQFFLGKVQLKTT